MVNTILFDYNNMLAYFPDNEQITRICHEAAEPFHAELTLHHHVGALTLASLYPFVQCQLLLRSWTDDFVYRGPASDNNELRHVITSEYCRRNSSLVQIVKDETVTIDYQFLPPSTSFLLLKI